MTKSLEPALLHESRARETSVGQGRQRLEEVRYAQSIW